MTPNQGSETTAEAGGRRMSAARQTCLHRDGACASWEECAHRVAKHSANRLRDAMALNEEVLRLGLENDRLCKALARAEPARPTR